MWHLIRVRDEWGRFYMAQPTVPRPWPGARVRVLGRSRPATEAQRLAGLLEERRLRTRHAIRFGFGRRVLRLVRV